MKHTATVTLPEGLWLDGVRHQEAVFRPLTGADEALLLETEGSLLPAQRITHLLARCLVSLGPLDPVTTEAVRTLTVGDREALLLHLRRLTLGDRMPCVLSCPASACGEKMDLDLKAGDFLMNPYPHAQEFQEKTVSENGVDYRVRFRLPRGADQESAAALALKDPQSAADLLLRRCVAFVMDAKGKVLDHLPSVVTQRLPPIMSALDPQAELILKLTCPVCETVFSTPFDTGAYFFQEMENRMKHLYREVHQLAFHYHWSEAEIMDMTSRKRHRYLDLLAEALTEEGRR